MTCQHTSCTITRPPTAYELELGWHIPCLNAKHAKETLAPGRRSDAHKKAKRRGYNATARSKGQEVEA